MEDSAFIAEVIAGVALFLIGFRLFRLASRTGGQPERQLGCFLVIAGISYIFYTIPVMFDTGSLEVALNFAGRATYGASVYFVLAFTQTVFRSEEPWSRWLLYALITSIAVGIGVSASGGDWEGFSISSPWFWCEWGGYTLATIWVATEAFLAFWSARKRMKLGLCEPVVANRYLLWCLFGVFQTCACLTVIPMYVHYEANNQQFSLTTDLLLGTFEILSAVAAWFVFFAPNSYRRWIARGAARANSAECG